MTPLEITAGVFLFAMIALFAFWVSRQPLPVTEKVIPLEPYLAFKKFPLAHSVSLDPKKWEALGVFPYVMEEKGNLFCSRGEHGYGYGTGYENASVYRGADPGRFLLLWNTSANVFSDPILAKKDIRLAERQSWYYSIVTEFGLSEGEYFWKKRRFIIRKGELYVKDLGSRPVQQLKEFFDIKSFKYTPGEGSL